MGEVINKAKGRIKQALGDLTGNRRLKREGRSDEAKGKVEGAIEDVKGVVKGAAKDVKSAAKDVKQSLKDA